MTTMRFDAAATIFSRSSAPPPPLISRRDGIEFVGPVHRQVEFRRLIERGQAQTPFFGLEARALRGGNADDLKAVARLFADAIDEMGGGRAGAEAEPHAGANQSGGALGGLAFQQFDGR